MADRIIAEIGERLRTQDTRATAHPIFLVQQRVRWYGFDPSFAGEAVWLDSDYDEVDDETEARLEAARLDCMPAEDGYTRTGYRDEWEYVTACFTEAAANRYIAENRHNLRDPRTYAASAYRNHEWIALRQFLMDLPAPTDQREEG